MQYLQKNIYTPTPPPQKQHGSDTVLGSVCTHLRVAIHPHLNRLGSEIAVNTDWKKNQNKKSNLF